MKLLSRMKKQVALATIMTLAFSTPVATMASDYSSHWAKDVITEWNAYGVVKGYEDGSFKPNNNMTRAEFAVVLSNVFGLVDTDKSISFSDVSADAWYQDAISKVAAAGMMQGADGKFNPKASITRQEVAVALVNAFNVTEKGNGNVEFTDEASIASWAKEQVELMASKGYISGRVDGQFDPKANITRAEVLKMLDNMTAALFNKAGTYTTDAKGNIIVNTQNVILKDMNISGDLYLAQGINLGDATLKDTTVEGNIFVAGGGVNSIHFDHVTAKKPVQVKAKKAVRLVSNNSQISVVIEAGQEVVLTGTFKEIIVPTGATLELKDATVEKITVLPEKADQAAIKIDKTSVVKELIANASVKVTGQGKIEKLYVKANGVSTTMRPGQVINEGGFDYKAPSNSSPSGGSGTVTEKEGYVELKSVKVNGTNTDLKNYGLDTYENKLTFYTREFNELKGIEPIEYVTLEFGNLSKGDQIQLTLQLGAFTQTVTKAVESGGKVTLKVSELHDLYKAQKDTIISSLKTANLYDTAQMVLNKLGLDFEEDYLADGSIDMGRVIEVTETFWDFYRDYKNHGTSAEVEKLISVLKDYGFDFSYSDSIGFGKNVSGVLTIKAGNLKAANYQVRFADQSRKQIKVESITVDSSEENLLDYISIEEASKAFDEDANVTFYMGNVKKVANLGNVKTITVKFANLREGDSLNVKTVFGAISKEKSFTVGKGGELTFTVEELKEAFVNNKDKILSKLSTDQYEAVVTILEKLGLNLNEDYLADGSIDMQNFANKFDGAWKLYRRYVLGDIKDETNQKTIDTIKAILEDYGFKFTSESIAFIGNKADGQSLESSITIDATGIAPAQYTFTIQR